MIAESTLNRQNRQHSGKTDESKLVLKQSFKCKHETKERTLSLNATTARNLLFPKMIQHNIMYLDS